MWALVCWLYPYRYCYLVEVSVPSITTCSPLWIAARVTGFAPGFGNSLIDRVWSNLECLGLDHWRNSGHRGVLGVLVHLYCDRPSAVGGNGD